jgi:hypothetical protein
LRKKDPKEKHWTVTELYLKKRDTHFDNFFDNSTISPCGIIRVDLVRK